MSLVKLHNHSQITLPQEIVAELMLSDGDVLDMQIQNGKIVMAPQTELPDEEKGFYTSDSQASFQRALKDVEEGRTYGPFQTAEDLLRSLKS